MFGQAATAVAGAAFSIIDVAGKGGALKHSGEYEAGIPFVNLKAKHSAKAGVGDAMLDSQSDEEEERRRRRKRQTPDENSMSGPREPSGLNKFLQVVSDVFRKVMKVFATPPIGSTSAQQRQQQQDELQQQQRPIPNL